MHSLTHLFLGVAASATIFTSAIAADLNPAAVAFALPDKIEWKQGIRSLPTGNPARRSVEARHLRRDGQMAAWRDEPSAFPSQ
jgi:hypothetical protein